MIARPTIVATLLLMAAGCLGACTGTGEGRVAGARGRCGGCHLTPERHLVPPATWEAVKDEHRARLHLSDPMMDKLEAEILRR